MLLQNNGSQSHKQNLVDLEVQKVLGQKVEKRIHALVATSDYVAFGGDNNKVTVYDKTGDLVLVSYIL